MTQHFKGWGGRPFSNTFVAGMGLLGLWLLALALLDLVSVPVNSKRSRHHVPRFVDEPEENMVLSGVKGKALYLFKGGKRHLFPEFYTFTAMGFNHTSIHRMVDDKLGALPIGELEEKFKELWKVVPWPLE